MGIPEMEVMKFWGFLTVRYLLNTGLSLLIIYLAFYNIKILRFSVKFYALAFVVFGMLFWVLLNLDLNLGYRLTFYVRRFLIHPLFLLILLPAFYYQKLKRNKAN
jgi:exosortase F-associated protein